MPVDPPRCSIWAVQPVAAERWVHEPRVRTNQQQQPIVNMLRPAMVTNDIVVLSQNFEIVDINFKFSCHFPQDMCKESLCRARSQLSIETETAISRCMHL